MPAANVSAQQHCILQHSPFQRPLHMRLKPHNCSGHHTVFYVQMGIPVVSVWHDSLHPWTINNLNSIQSCPMDHMLG